MGVARPLRSCCAPCSEMILACPKPPTLASPDRENAAAGHYRETFAAYGMRPQDTVLRLPNRRVYILPHVQEFLAGLDSTWEDRLTRWTLGVRNALEEGKALPPFPTAAWTLESQNGFEAGNELSSLPDGSGGNIGRNRLGSGE